jgi:hypothetical protein
VGVAGEGLGTRAAEQEGAPRADWTSSATERSTTGGGGGAARGQGRGVWRAEDAESGSHGVWIGCENGGCGGRVQPVGGCQGITAPCRGKAPAAVASLALVPSTAKPPARAPAARVLTPCRARPPGRASAGVAVRALRAASRTSPAPALAARSASAAASATRATSASTSDPPAPESAPPGGADVSLVPATSCRASVTVESTMKGRESRACSHESMVKAGAGGTGVRISCPTAQGLGRRATAEA